jgi:hypothetical protein
LPFPFFSFLLLQQEEDDGDGNFLAVAFFSGFFWKVEGDGNCRSLLFVFVLL